MARLEDIPEAERRVIIDLPLPTYASTPLAAGPPLAERRVAVVSTAGLQRRTDRPFSSDAGDYRVIPADTPSGELSMSHLSPNFDRTGFQADVNVVLPIDRLRELAGDGVIGSVADLHYSFMGATSPAALEPRAREVATHLHADGVDAVLLVPV